MTYRSIQISTILSIIFVQLLDAEHLADEYVNHFGRNFSKVKWNLVRSCLKGSTKEINCVKSSGPMRVMCDICKHTGQKCPNLPSYAVLLQATFFEHILTFPHTNYNEVQIDIIKCHHQLMAPVHSYHDVDIFYVTRGLLEKSAYFLRSVYSYFHNATGIGMRYILKEPYVTWN